LAVDRSGIASVQFIIDGADFGAADTASPYKMSADTTLLTNGLHKLSARAIDKAGNIGTANTISVKVANSAPPPPPPPPPPVTTNLILNPSLETAGSAGLPQYWFQGNWGVNQVNFVYPARPMKASRERKWS